MAEAAGVLGHRAQRIVLAADVRPPLVVGQRPIDGNVIVGNQTARIDRVEGGVRPVRAANQLGHLGHEVGL